MFLLLGAKIITLGPLIGLMLYFCSRATRIFYKYYFSANNKHSSVISVAMLRECASREAINCANDGIVKSASDLRQYRGLELSNKLKVMLISDPLTDKAAASMDVNIGSFCDPENLPGLAHFCEHMLFLGTVKYPNEDEYSKYVSQHAGSSNAYTSDEHTNYYFDIGHQHLREILDRFSQFFLSPLFDANCTDREVNAVHSEHEKNIMSDGWRMLQLDKSTSDPNHKHSKFSTGNKDTLDTIPKANNISVREELLRYHERYYSANVMSLAVLGKESLVELEAMVVEMFSQIANKNVQALRFENSPYSAEYLKKFMYAVPIKDVRNLILTFPIPDCNEMYKTSPAGYLGHLIGHEGPGSILSELKRRGWVNSLAAGDHLGARGYDSFLITVDLSEEGIKHMEDIITCMFQYIQLLKKSEVQEWIFNEIKELNALNFRFKDKERPTTCVTNISMSLHYYPLEDALTAGRLLSEYKPELIEMILEKLVPSNMRVAAVAKCFEKLAVETEKWYGTKYHVESISDELIDQWSRVDLNPNFRLPPKNEFIPSDFVISPLSADHSAVPTLIKCDKLGKLWFKQDDQFKLPKACLLVELFSPIAYVSPQNANKVYMFTELFKDALNEYAYAAELAGLSYTLKSSVYGIELVVKGYHDKQKVLLEKIFKKIATFKVDPKRFEIIKELYMRILKNFQAEQPYSQAAFYTHAIKSEVAWLKTDLAVALERLSCDQLQTFIQDFMSRLSVQTLAHGNLKRADSLSLTQLVEDILREDAAVVPLVSSQLTRYRDVCIPRGSSYVYQYHNSVRDISAINFFLQVGQDVTHEHVLLRLFEQIIKEPCFNVLRTKENLGYIVGSAVTMTNGVQGLRVVIQSERSPDYLEQRIEAFLNHVKVMIDEMTVDEFNSHVDALATIILEKPKKLMTETRKYWMEILTEQFQFTRPETEAAHLKTITKDQVANFYNDYIHVNGPKRAKLVVHVLGKNLESCPTTPVPQTEENPEFYPCPPIPQSKVIEDIVEFKKHMQLYPRVAADIAKLEAKLTSSL